MCVYKHILVLGRFWPQGFTRSPSTLTANSTLGLKQTILRPRYTIYYYLNIIHSFIADIHTQNFSLRLFFIIIKN